jgi:hypothetical protein
MSLYQNVFQYKIVEIIPEYYDDKEAGCVMSLDGLLALHGVIKDESDRIPSLC